jgi:hypothetical protein
MMRAILSCCAVFAGMILFGISKGSDDGSRQHATESRVAPVKEFEDLAHSIVKMTVYEGLPHPVVEPEVFASERKQKSTIEVHDFLFYATPLTMSRADWKNFRRVFTDGASFQEYAGPKMCGSFHPDLLVEWEVGGARYQAQLCLGCGEMKVFGPGGYEAIYDINEKAYERFGEIVLRIRRRPPLDFDAIQQRLKSIYTRTSAG